MEDSSTSLNRVKLRDGRFLAYIERGVPKEKAKFKIIIVHGFLSSKDMHFPASNELVEELGVYFLFYDRAGCGESDSIAKRSLKSEADDIAELADQLEIGPKFYLIGVSMGTYPTWGCLRHIPHRLSGVAIVAGAVNYRWPSLPENLIKNDCRRVFIEYAPGLLRWRVIQKLFLLTHLVFIMMAVYLRRKSEQPKQRTPYPMLTKDNLQGKILDTLKDDFVTCYGQWDFEPADLSISQESSVYMWHGTKDLMVPVQLPRCILQKQPLINYFEIPQGGHLIVNSDGVCDAILRALLLGEEQEQYKPILELTDK